MHTGFKYKHKTDNIRTINDFYANLIRVLLSNHRRALQSIHTIHVSYTHSLSDTLLSSHYVLPNIPHIHHIRVRAIRVLNKSKFILRTPSHTLFSNATSHTASLQFVITTILYVYMWQDTRLRTLYTRHVI